MLDTIVGWLLSALNFVTAFLPNSPFKLIDNGPIQPYLESINWVFPISEIIAILEAWVAAIAIFYVYQAILRWVKAIE